jgi:hypothetical protein
MTNIPRKTALITALAAAWLALAVVFAGIFIIEEHIHDCTGAGCRICFKLQIAQRLIESLGRPGVHIAVIGFIACACSLIKTQLLFYSKKPIELKVRFNC